MTNVATESAEQAPAYRVDAFRDRTAELERLRIQARAFMVEERPLLGRLGLPDRGRLLDVGCGPGFVAEALGDVVPGLVVYGVDLDPGVVPRGGRFATGRAGALPVADGAFDAAYARLVLRHVPDPAEAASEMRRAVRPGGRVLVADSDDGTLVLDPMPPGFAGVLAARQEGFRRRGADPEIGRKLPGVLARAGLEDVRTEVLTVHTGRLGASAFASIVLAPIADAIDPDLLPADEVAKVADALSDWAATPGAFGAFSVMLSGGACPARGIDQAGRKGTP